MLVCHPRVSDSVSLWNQGTCLTNKLSGDARLLGQRPLFENQCYGVLELSMLLFISITGLGDWCFELVNKIFIFLALISLVYKTPSPNLLNLNPWYQKSKGNII